MLVLIDNEVLDWVKRSKNLLINSALNQFEKPYSGHKECMLNSRKMFNENIFILFSCTLICYNMILFVTVWIQRGIFNTIGGQQFSWFWSLITFNFKSKLRTFCTIQHVDYQISKYIFHKVHHCITCIEKGNGIVGSHERGTYIPKHLGPSTIKSKANGPLSK